MIIEVVFNAPPYGPFDYIVVADFAKDTSNDLSLVGRRVEVPFGRSRRRGYVLKEKQKSAFGESALKSVLSVIDDKPVLDADNLRFAEDMAERCLASPAVFCDFLYPADLRITIPLFSRAAEPRSAEHSRSTLRKKDRPPVSVVCAKFEERFERYRAIVAETLSRGESALLVMPAVSDVRYALARFADLSPIEWNSSASLSAIESFFGKISSGCGHFIVGTRRAVFLRPSKLSKIIIERDYDYGHKDGRKPYYVSRDAALAAASVINGVEAVFGGLVFSSQIFEMLSSGAAKRTGNMPAEYSASPFETEPPADFSRPSQVSERLSSLLDAAYAVGSSAIIHSGRKGTLSGYYCRACSAIIKCPDCDVALSLVEIKGVADFRCPYCSKTFGASPRCPKCGSSEAKSLSFGAGGMASEIKRLYPAAKVATVSSLSRDVDGVADADFIVTTAPVPPYLTKKKTFVVAITDAGLDMAHPEFTAAERSFLRAAEYADFAGGARLVVFPASRLAGAGDIFAKSFGDFYAAELSARKELVYPPYGGLAAMTFAGKNEKKVFAAAVKAVEGLAALAADGVEALGPSPGPRKRLRGNYIYKVMIKYSAPSEALRNYLLSPRATSGVAANVDAAVL